MHMNFHIRIFQIFLFQLLKVMPANLFSVNLVEKTSWQWKAASISMRDMT